MYNSIKCIIFVSIFVQSETRGKQWLCPPSNRICKCHSNGVLLYADCRHRHLTAIPKFEQTYQRLLFSENLLSNLSYSTFENIRSWPISELFIGKCKIRNIAVNTFDNITTLEFIDFSGNAEINIIQLTNWFSHSKLKGLDLSKMPLNSTTITRFFNTKASSSLIFLRLASCKLSTLTKSMFEHLYNLKEIDLNGNSLGSFDLAVLPPVESLVLQNIKLFDLSLLNNTWVHNLVRLDVANNNIRDTVAIFKYGHMLGKLKFLSMDNNPLLNMSLETFSELKSLYSLSLCNALKNFKYFEGIQSKSLKYLNISNNNLIFKPKNITNVFNLSRNITNLLMHNTKLENWTENEIYELFLPLCDNLLELRLTNSYFQNIPSKALRCFKKLDILDLSYNNITGWSDDEKPFENVTVNIRFLLKNNLIEVINETSFPDSYMNNNSTLFLAFQQNPFSCTCKAHWFRNWMKANYYRLGGPLGNNLRCGSPKDMNGTVFTNYDPSYEECFGFEMEVTIGIVVCCSCIILVSLATYLVQLYQKKYPNKNMYTIIE